MERLALGRRAAWRRVIAVLKARKQRFVVGGALGLSLWLDRLVDGELELLVRPEEAAAALAALETAGFRIEPEGESAARAGSRDRGARLAWGLPPPLGGALDEVWFAASRRRRLLDLRVRVAPLEELVFVRLAAQGDSLGDDVVREAILAHGPALDWPRLLRRAAGLEALLLAHVYLLRHRHGERARAAVPSAVLAELRERVDALNSEPPAPVEGPVLP